MQQAQATANPNGAEPATMASAVMHFESNAALRVSVLRGVAHCSLYCRTFVYTAAASHDFAVTNVRLATHTDYALRTSVVKCYAIARPDGAI